MDNDTHEKIYSIKFRKTGFFALISILLCSLIGGVYCLLVFTPLHYSIPGYPDANFRSQAIYNAVKIDSLESAMLRWELYSRKHQRDKDFASWKEGQKPLQIRAAGVYFIVPSELHTIFVIYLEKIILLNSPLDV